MMAFENEDRLTPLASLAEKALSELNAANLDGRPVDDELIDEIAALLHWEWQQDNADRGIPEEKNRPYGELSTEQKEEYRTVVRVTNQKLKNVRMKDRE